MKYYKLCRVKCLRCKDVLEHVNQTKTDSHFHIFWCNCGKVGLDPEAVGYRVLGDPSDYVDLSEEWPEERYEKLEQELGGLRFEIRGIYPPYDEENLFVAHVQLLNLDIPFALWFANKNQRVQITYANAANPEALEALYGNALVNVDDLCVKLEQLIRELYINIWTIYPPAGDNYYGDCYLAAVDMFIPGSTFKIWFKEDEGQIEIAHIERWYFG